MIFLLRLVFLPVRLAFGATGLSFRIGYKTGRLLGYRRLLVLGIGVGIGLLVAPVPGRELRAKLRERLEGGALPPPDDTSLADQVRFELSHSPRTWHLAQPQVEVVAGRVVLHGEVADETARQELERAAAGVRGVAAVDNLVGVTGTSATT